MRKFLNRTVDYISKGKFLTPHAQVTGIVSHVTKEDDGDIHIRLQDINTKSFIMCEIIPEFPLKMPRLDSMIRVQGIVRYDGDHKWWEIHPVLKWDMAK